LIYWHPSLPFLVLVLKSLLYKHSVMSAYNGGLSSYSLTIWAVAFLNAREQDSADYGELFLLFLAFYGTEFQPSTMGIDIAAGGSFFELRTENAHAVTIDPVNGENNTTRSSFNIGQILDLFRDTNQALLACSDH
jgi:DNA polymerase sigma